MSAVTISIPEDLAKQLEPYDGQLDDLLRIGLRHVKMAASLALFRQGDVSLWKAARLAGVSLREMTQYAVANGLRATVDEETVREELM
jgi:hypothetical protein